MPAQVQVRQSLLFLERFIDSTLTEMELSGRVRGSNRVHRLAFADRQQLRRTSPAGGGGLGREHRNVATQPMGVFDYALSHRWWGTCPLLPPILAAIRPAL